jgi:hypothetical protein
VKHMVIMAILEAHHMLHLLHPKHRKVIFISLRFKMRQEAPRGVKTLPRGFKMHVGNQKSFGV